MSSAESQTAGYAVTLEVTVPFAVAQRAADRLDAQWRLESWSPEAAAYAAVEQVLKAAGLHHEVHLSTRRVAPGPGAAG